MAAVNLTHAPPPPPVGYVTQAEAQGELTATPAGALGVHSTDHFRVQMTRGYVDPAWAPRASQGAGGIHRSSYRQAACWTRGSAAACRCCREMSPPHNLPSLLPPHPVVGGLLTNCRLATGTNAPRSLHLGDVTVRHDEEWILERPMRVFHDAWDRLRRNIGPEPARVLWEVGAQPELQPVFVKPVMLRPFAAQHVHR